MLQLLIALALLASQDCQQGWLSQYSRAATDRVIANRSVHGRTAFDLPDNWIEYDGLIAVESCSDLGKMYRVYWREHSGTFLAWDCSGHASTSAWMLRNNIIGEVDGWTARRWRSVGRGMKGAVVCEAGGAGER